MARASRKTENLPRIAQAVLTVGKESGFSTMPIAKIAKEAGISPGTLYLYFKDKDEMMDWIVAYIQESGQEYFFRNYDPNADLRSRFSCLSLNLLEFYTQNPLEFAFIDFFGARNFGLPVSVFSQKMEDEIVTMYTQGLKQKQIKGLPFFAILALIHGPLSALARSINLGKFTKSEVSNQVLVDAVWDSVSVK